MSEIDPIKDQAEALLRDKIGDQVITAHDFIILCIAFEGLVMAFYGTDRDPRLILALRDAIFRHYMATGACDISGTLWDHIYGEFVLEFKEK